MLHEGLLGFIFRLFRFAVHLNSDSQFCGAFTMKLLLSFSKSTGTREMSKDCSWVASSKILTAPYSELVTKHFSGISSEARRSG